MWILTAEVRFLKYRINEIFFFPERKVAHMSRNLIKYVNDVFDSEVLQSRHRSQAGTDIKNLKSSSVFLLLRVPPDLTSKALPVFLTRSSKIQMSSKTALFACSETPRSMRAHSSSSLFLYYELCSQNHIWLRTARRTWKTKTFYLLLTFWLTVGLKETFISSCLFSIETNVVTELHFWIMLQVL